jgi:hypothetical protein
MSLHLVTELHGVAPMIKFCCHMSNKRIYFSACNLVIQYSTILLSLQELYVLYRCAIMRHVTSQKCVASIATAFTIMRVRHVLITDCREFRTAAIGFSVVSLCLHQFSLVAHLRLRGDVISLVFCLWD